MRRVFYIALGATVGVLVVRKLGQAAERYGPAGMSESMGGAVANLAAAIQDFATEVRVGMAERETELRAGLGLDGRYDQLDAHTLEVAAHPYSLDPDHEPPHGFRR